MCPYSKEIAIKRKKIEAGRLSRPLAALLALAMLASSGAWAQEGSLSQDARKAGTAIGSTAHDIGVGAKKAGIAVGQGAKKAGLAIGHAAEAGGVAFWHAIKGEKR